MSFDTLINVVILGVALLLMVRFGFGLHLMRPAHSHAHGGTQSSPAGGTSSEDQDVDPVCCMTVDRSTAIRATVAGKTYSFCSDACSRKFEAAPAAYLARAAAAPRKSHHGCCG